MRNLIVIIAAFWSALVLSAEVEVNQAWVRLMPPGSHMTAAYLAIENHSDNALTLQSVSSIAAKDCSIHQTVNEDGVSRMHQLEGIKLPSNETVVMQPGGIHIMLMGISRPLIKGDKFPMKLKFSDGTEQDIQLDIRSR